MSEFSAEQLMAYADGELPAAQAQAIEQAARRDAALAQRIEGFRASRRLLRQSYADQPATPVPQKLLDLLQAPTSAPDKVVPLRRRAAAPPLWKQWAPLALAASLIIAVGLYAPGLLFRPVPASDALSLALESLPSGELFTGAGGQEIVALGSLQLADGAYCRSYESSQGAATTRGLACRSAPGHWQTRAPEPVAQGADGSYQTASGMALPPGARALTPEQETELLRRHWGE